MSAVSSVIRSANSYNTAVKDFVRSAPRKKRARSHSQSARAAAPSRFIKLMIGFVVAVVIAAALLMMVKSLNWTDFFESESQETVLFFTEKVDQSGAYVVRFLFDELRVDVYPVSADLSLEVMGGYGTYRFQAVYPLLILEGKDPSYIRSAFSLSSGILIDELWRADTAVLDLTGQTRFQRFLLRNILSNRQLSFSQKFSWLALLSDQRTEYVLHEPLTVLPSPEFQNLGFSLSQSACTVALINTTPLNGLAGRIADLLESHNFRVVRTTSDLTPVEKTTVLFGEDLSDSCRIILDKVEKLVPGGILKQADAAETVRNRADLVVRLGTDLAQ